MSAKCQGQKCQGQVFNLDINIKDLTPLTARR